MENQKIEVTKPSKRIIPWYYQKFYNYASATLLVLIIVWLLYQVAFLLTPLVNFFSILFTPIVASYFLYYLLRPVVRFLERFNIPRVLSILCIYLIFAICIVFFVFYGGPVLAQQVTAIANTSVDTLEKVKQSSSSLLFNVFHVNLDYEIEQRLFGVVQQVTTLLSKNIIDFLGLITRITTILLVIPFIVFYFLKDDDDFASGFLDYFPEDFGREVRKILRNIDHTLSNYITGLVLVSSSVGALLFIGYLIIGLKYAFILSLIAIIFMTIPFLGPFLSIAPALLVALSQSHLMVLKVIVVFLIVQQTEANFLSPQIIGQRLNIHPLTIILLLLAAGSLYGLVGLILATPTYAVLKVLLENLYKIYKLRSSHWGEKISSKTS